MPLPLSVATGRKLARLFPLHKNASPVIRDAVQSDDAALFCRVYLDSISRPRKRVRKRLGASPLLGIWSETTMDLSGRERELAATLDEMSDHAGQNGRNRKKKKSRRQTVSEYDEVLANWLLDPSGMPGPWETIVLSEILLREGPRISPERCVAVLSVLADAVQNPPLGGLFERTETVGFADDPVRRMIASGEAQWISSLLLSPLQRAATMQKSSAVVIEKVLLESTDDDGILHASILSGLSSWLAPIVRSTFWADVFEQPLWSKAAEARLCRMTERNVMLLIPDNSGITHVVQDSPAETGPAPASLFGILLPLVNSQAEKPLRKLIDGCSRPPETRVRRPAAFRAKKSDTVAGKGSRKSGRTPKPNTRKSVPPASWQSDSSCVAVLRSGIDHGADVITAEWHTSEIRLMLAAAGITVLDGSWHGSLRVGDQAVSMPDSWKCSCWFLDPETVFLELEGEQTESVKFIRQILLAPCERLAVLTDSVTTQQAGAMVYLTTSLALAPGSLSTADSITRESGLVVGPRSVRTFPLWLPDDRIQHTQGSYRERDGQMELSGISPGGVTMPLVLDWHPERADAAADWAKLTVTESRRILGSHEAAAYRIRIGRYHVLIYRSLMAGKASRAVLGLHTWDETVYSRIPFGVGQLSPLVEVESLKSDDQPVGGS